MAQDFRTAFSLGEDDRHISAVDEEGVALAEIKALETNVAEKDVQIATLRRAQSDVDRRLEAKYAAGDGSTRSKPTARRCPSFLETSSPER